MPGCDLLHPGLFLFRRSAVTKLARRNRIEPVRGRCLSRFKLCRLLMLFCNGSTHNLFLPRLLHYFGSLCCNGSLLRTAMTRERFAWEHRSTVPSRRNLVSRSRWHSSDWSGRRRCIPCFLATLAVLRERFTGKHDRFGNRSAVTSRIVVS